MGLMCRIKNLEKKVKELCARPTAEPVDLSALGSLQDKINTQNISIYRISQPAAGVNFRRWLEPPAALPHAQDVADIFTGPADPQTGFPTHPNTPTTQGVEPDFNYGGPSDQQEMWAWYTFDTPMYLREVNANTGETGDVYLGQCCGIPQLLQKTTTNTPADDRGLLDSTLIPAGTHLLYARLSDVSANGGFDFEVSVDGEEWSNITGAMSEKPVVECQEVLMCDPIPEGWSLCRPELCAPVHSPIENGLSEEEVSSLIPPPVVVPEQVICAGDFSDVSSRTGWLHTWSPSYTTSSGTVVEGWAQVGTAETSPDCATDITVNVTLGKSYLQLRNMWGRVWYDVRLLVNGAAVTTFTFQDYHYEDDIGQTNLDDDVTPLSSAHFARASVPAGATITVEILRRHNFVAGPVAIASPFGRVISGLRAHFNVHYTPTNVVTGRQ